MNKILAHTVWAKDFYADNHKYLNLKRGFFPAFDTVMILAGFGGFFFGVITLDFFWPPLVVHTYTILLIIASFFSLIGDLILSRWRMEIIGVTTQMGLSIVYLSALLYRTVSFTQLTVFGFFYVSTVLISLIFRLNFVRDESLERRRLRKLRSS